MKGMAHLRPDGSHSQYERVDGRVCAGIRLLPGLGNGAAPDVQGNVGLGPRDRAELRPDGHQARLEYNIRRGRRRA